MITGRDIDILKALVRYYVLNRQQIQRLVFPNDPNGRVTRRRLQALKDLHLLNRQPLEVVHHSQTAAPVYYPSRQGCELLAELTGDDKFLLTPTAAPIRHHAFHWLAVSDTHIVLDEAIASQEEVRVVDWINEWDVVNKDESAAEKRYRLFTLIRESPRLVSAPDAAFLLETQGHSKTFYLEQDRATSGVQQVASSKTQGYATMAEMKLERRHFSATVPGFSVLMIAPNDRRRDALRKAIAAKPGAQLWRFATTSDVVPEKILHCPIWYRCESNEPVPLVAKKQIHTSPDSTSLITSEVQP